METSMYTLTEERQLDYEKLSLVASKTENAVVITDKYRIIEWVNEAFTQITEYTIEEAIGKSPGALLQGKGTDPKDIKALQKKLNSGESFVQEILNYTKSGKSYWLRLSITPVRNEFGEITNYIAIESDITKEKKQEQELKAALKQSKEAEERLKEALAHQEQLSRELMLADLKFKSTFKQEKNMTESLNRYRSDLQSTKKVLVNKEKMASIGLLTAGIAHEINNPINFISSGVSSLKNLSQDLKVYLSDLDKEVLSKAPKDLQDKYQELTESHEISELMLDISQMLEDVETGATRTVEIIESLRISARGDEEEKIATSINKLIDASLILLKSKVGGNIKIEKAYSELPELPCLPGPLNQVFTNIISNAIQAIAPKKGLIKVSTSETKEHQIICIEDNGAGIPEKVKSRIFDASFTTKQVGEGTGLGMSISKEIIEKRHQGTIEFKSKEGEGTTFKITLPK